MVSGACRCGVSLLSRENAMGRGEKWMGEDGLFLGKCSTLKHQETNCQAAAQNYGAIRARSRSRSCKNTLPHRLKLHSRCGTFLQGQAEKLASFLFQNRIGTSITGRGRGRARRLPLHSEDSTNWPDSIFQSLASPDLHLPSVQRQHRHEANPNEF